MSIRLKPVDTASISWPNGQPHSNQFGDIYYSREDGFHESKHVFINGNELTDRFKGIPNADSTQFVIGEMGFGTGLNFLLTYKLWKQYAPKSARLYYFSCEKYPLKRNDLRASLKGFTELKEVSFELMNRYPVLVPGFHLIQFSEGDVNLILMIGDALESYNELLICGEPKLEEELRNTSFDA